MMITNNINMLGVGMLRKKVLVNFKYLFLCYGVFVFVQYRFT